MDPELCSKEMKDLKKNVDRKEEDELCNSCSYLFMGFFFFQVQDHVIEIDVTMQ